MNYAERKAAARTRTTKPTQTDQSQSRETDRMIIVERFLTYGAIHGSTKPPIYGDFTGLPQNRRDAIEMAKRMKHLHSRLPENLRGHTLEQLANLTKEQLIEKLTPKPPEPPAPKEEAK